MVPILGCGIQIIEWMLEMRFNKVQYVDKMHFLGISWHGIINAVHILKKLQEDYCANEKRF